jgi:hypothetical protein
MNGKRYILKGFLVMLLATFLGCISIGKFGKADVTYFEIKTPSELNGQSKSNIIKVLGLPDIDVKAGGNEYWGYKNKRGFFIILFGKTEEKDLVLVFKGDKVTSSYLVDKGSSTGIIVPPGAVAN